MGASVKAQTRALLAKSALYQRRNTATNLCLVIAPVFFCVLLASLQILANHLILGQRSNKCGCQCLSCCTPRREALPYTPEEQARVDAGQQVPRQYRRYEDCSPLAAGWCERVRNATCRQYNDSNCSLRFSSPGQSIFCPIPHPSSWPPVLQTPRLTWRAGGLGAQWLPYTGSNLSAVRQLAANLADAPELPNMQAVLDVLRISPLALLNLRPSSLLRLAVPLLAPGGLLSADGQAVDAAQMSRLELNFGSGQKSNPDYYLENAFINSNSAVNRLQLLLPEGGCNATGLGDGITETSMPLPEMLLRYYDATHPALLRPLLRFLNISSADQLIAGLSDSPVGNISTACVDLVAREANDTPTLERRLYCGFGPARCDGTNFIREYGGAWDFRQLGPTTLEYDAYYNLSLPLPDMPVNYRIPQLINMATRAWTRTYWGDLGVSRSVRNRLMGLQSFPKLPTVIKLDFSVLLGPLFYTWVIQMLMPSLLQQLVYEKEKRLRMMMKMHGLGDGAYWLVTYLWYLTIYIVYMVFFAVFGSLIRLKMFTANSYTMQAVLYFIFGNNMIAFMFLLSSLFASSRTATVVAFLYVFASGLIGELLLRPLMQQRHAYLAAVQLMPGFALYRGLFEFSEYSIRTLLGDSGGLTWAHLRDPGCGMVGAWASLAAEWPLFMAAGWYLEQVAGSGTGMRRHPLYFLRWMWRKQPGEGTADPHADTLPGGALVVAAPASRRSSLSSSLTSAKSGNSAAAAAAAEAAAAAAVALKQGSPAPSLDLERGGSSSSSSGRITTAAISAAEGPAEAVRLEPARRVVALPAAAAGSEAVPAVAAACSRGGPVAEADEGGGAYGAGDVRGCSGSGGGGGDTGAAQVRPCSGGGGEAPAEGSEGAVRQVVVVSASAVAGVGDDGGGGASTSTGSSSPGYVSAECMSHSEGGPLFHKRSSAGPASLGRNSAASTSSSYSESRGKVHPGYRVHPEPQAPASAAAAASVSASRSTTPRPSGCGGAAGSDGGGGSRPPSCGDAAAAGETVAPSVAAAPSRSGGSGTGGSRSSAAGGVAMLLDTAAADVASDVAAEAARVAAMDEATLASTPIVVQGLRKEFKLYGAADGAFCGGLFDWLVCRGRTRRLAVKSLTLGIERGECFGLLGPNGAGKTTALHMLTGFMEPSAGDAAVEGRSVRTRMPEIYRMMGVCPQHDLLWEQLTGEEHLRFYGRLKGLQGAALTEAVAAALKSVKLDWQGAGRRRVSTYSGGMKRRLSVAISFMGQPRVVYLDEPSTGLDPASRRNLWDVVRSNKDGRAIILTTHSMEEAEILCDRLGIFVDGQLVCIGNPREITSRYAGYLVFTLTVGTGHEDAAQAFVQHMSPNARLTYAVGGTFKYELPTTDVSLAGVFDAMAAAKGRMQVLDWGVANATLEEVFIKFARQIGAETKDQ